IRAHLRN
ncbi:Late transcription factor VLTF-4 (1), partial [Monkeypox virus]